MTLYKVKKENNKIIEKIDSKPYNFVEYNSFVDHIGIPLVGNLRSDEKYVFIINGLNIKYWSKVNNREIMYNIQLKKSILNKEDFFIHNYFDKFIILRKSNAKNY